MIEPLTVAADLVLVGKDHSGIGVDDDFLGDRVERLFCELILCADEGNELSACQRKRQIQISSWGRRITAERETDLLVASGMSMQRILDFGGGGRIIADAKLP